MPPPSSRSPVTGAATPQFYVHADDSTGHFRDASGRCLLLRGINLASSAKTPVGQSSQQLAGFWEGGESGDISFVNRVLDLDLDEDDPNSADAHLRRLRSWGFNCLRYVTTWESIEHRGPGQYDEEYLQYTVRMLRKCKEHGFVVYVDPHQDLWSRYAGGDGAPLWTLLACGMNPRNFTVTNAAVIQCEWPDPAKPRPEDFPDMIWASNYTRLAVMTVMTLFFAGRTYAPLCTINQVNIQDYLQSHYIAAYRKLGEAIGAAGDLYDTCVIGWDSMNEPNHGLVGLEDVRAHSKKTLLKIGPMPTAYEAMKLGMGIATTVEHWKFGSLGAKKSGSITVDPKGAKAWQDPEADKKACAKYSWTRSEKWRAGECIWALHRVWDSSTQEVLQPAYFGPDGAGGDADFGRDFWQPHWLDWSRMVREVHPEAIHFVHSPVFEVPPSFKEETYRQALSNRAAFSAHFYDGLTLITKHWNWFNADAIGLIRGKYATLPLAIRFGESAIRKAMRDQLGYLRQDTFDSMGNYPSMMGEIGIPFDLDKREAYRTGDFKNQARALDASMNACDGENLFNYTMWTYNPENSHAWGENWNGEDLSLWSADDVKQKGSARVRSDDASEDSDKSDTESTPALSGMRSSEADGEGGPELDAGARAIEAFARPFPMAVAGRPISIDFEIKSSSFTLVIEVLPDDLTSDAPGLPTEIFLPSAHYGHPERQTEEIQPIGFRQSVLGKYSSRRGTPSLELAVSMSRGRYELDGHFLKWYHRDNLRSDTQLRREKIVIKRKGGPRPEVLAAIGETAPSTFQSFVDSCKAFCAVA